MEILAGLLTALVASAALAVWATFAVQMGELGVGVYNARGIRQVKAEIRANVEKAQRDRDVILGRMPTLPQIREVMDALASERIRELRAEMRAERERLQADLDVQVRAAEAELEKARATLEAERAQLQQRLQEAQAAAARPQDVASLSRAGVEAREQKAVERATVLAELSARFGEDILALVKDKWPMAWANFEKHPWAWEKILGPILNRLLTSGQFPIDGAAGPAGGARRPPPGGGSGTSAW